MQIKQEPLDDSSEDEFEQEEVDDPISVDPPIARQGGGKDFDALLLYYNQTNNLDTNQTRKSKRETRKKQSTTKFIVP